MSPSSTSRVDLHCHSTASVVSKLGVQRALGLPECATPPEDVYELAKRRGMDFVTITDHDAIDGALQLAGRYDDAFVSEELTAWFRGESQAVHVLCWGITPDDHERLQALVVVGGDPPAEDVDGLRLAAKPGRELLGDEGVVVAAGELQRAVDRVVVGDRHEVHPAALGELVHVLGRGRALRQAQRTLDTELGDHRCGGVAVQVDPAGRGGAHRRSLFGLLSQSATHVALRAALARQRVGALT